MDNSFVEMEEFRRGSVRQERIDPISFGLDRGK